MPRTFSLDDFRSGGASGTGTLRTLFSIFALSGFSGLIYESIWSHYLKLFLGHAAYAQTLVLAIFMGGMAIGSWLCSRYSVSWQNLLRAYAVVEGIVGVCALLFHGVFDTLTTLSYIRVIPSLGSSGAVALYKWTLSAVMILPQSVLLGMTFPLMTGGIIRLAPDSKGRAIGLAYFTNSIGAAVGVLVSGFLLIKAVGLPGTLRIAGTINLGIGAFVWYLAQGLGAAPERATGRAEAASARPLLLLAVSLVTGAASFIYEIGWIRMLSLVLGSSNHAFELMLSAFIFGLAAGGFWIRRRIDGSADTVRLLVIMQVAMGLCALATLVMYGRTFEVMRWLVANVPATHAGYGLFSVSGNAIALAVMLPATFCAGTTLPLITATLLRSGYGERGIGEVYAANTVGAIAGVFVAIHIGLPSLGLKGLITLGATLDMGLGLVLLWSALPKSDGRGRALALTALCLAAVIAVLAAVTLDPYRMASGVYRSGDILTPADTKITYHRDGKTATVSILVDRSGVTGISTNGKVDAAITMSPEGAPSPDETTMVLAAVLPMAMNPSAKVVANIGLGSGLTTNTLLANGSLEQVDTVEIERRMVEAARYFGSRVARVYRDPRSRIFLDDAKTFFASQRQKYDIIISEPSNPWVSGVAGLFSEEFYRMMTRHLAKDGVFVQWIQLYEINTELVVSVLKAVENNFNDYAVYATTGVNMLVLAKAEGMLGEIDASLLAAPPLAEDLKRTYVANIQDVALRKLGDKRSLAGVLASYAVRPNSDYYPVLDQNAAQARFLRSYAIDMQGLAASPLPVLEMLDVVTPSWQSTNVTPSPYYPKSQEAFTAMALYDFFVHGTFSPRFSPGDELRRRVERFRDSALACRSGDEEQEWLNDHLGVMAILLPNLRPVELEGVWRVLFPERCMAELTEPRRQWIALFQAVGRRDAASMAAASRSVLEQGWSLPPAALKYAVGAGMLGSFVSGDPAGAQRFWSLYREKLFGDGPPDVLFRLLSAGMPPR